MAGQHSERGQLSVRLALVVLVKFGIPVRHDGDVPAPALDVVPGLQAPDGDVPVVVGDRRDAAVRELLCDVEALKSSFDGNIDLLGDQVEDTQLGLRKGCTDREPPVR